MAAEALRKQAAGTQIYSFQDELKARKPKRQPPNIQTEDRWVDPIRNKDDVRKCLDFLDAKVVIATRKDTKLAVMRNRMLFIIGINVGLRVSDLIELQWKKIFEDDMRTFRKMSTRKEIKTEKYKAVCPNAAIKNAVSTYLKESGIVPSLEGYIFIPSRGSKDRHISDSSVEELMKELAAAVGLKGNYNTHSLRKTYAYHKYMMYVEMGDPLALVKVQKDLNHRNSLDTARYLGITRDEQVTSSMQLGDYWGFEKVNNTKVIQGML